MNVLRADYVSNERVIRWTVLWSEVKIPTQIKAQQDRIIGSVFFPPNRQCDFRFDLFFSFSFSFSFASKLKQPTNTKRADEDVSMICLNTVHR